MSRVVKLAACVAVVFASSVRPSAADVIWDNGAPGGGLDYLFSQRFTNLSVHAQAADDFVLPAGPNGELQWEITGVRWSGLYQGDVPPALIAHYNFKVLLYADRGDGAGPVGGPGEPTSAAFFVDSFLNSEVGETAIPGAGPGWPDYNYAATLHSPVTLSAQSKYWIAIQAQSTFVQSGGGSITSWFWAGRAGVQLHEGVQGFDTGVDSLTYWTDSSDVFFNTHPVDLSFQLLGTPVPEPATMSLILIGVAVLRRRSRR